MGHSLGLTHDGREFPDTYAVEGYYEGDLEPNNPLSWGTIMGEAVAPCACRHCQARLSITYLFR